MSHEFTAYLSDFYLFKLSEMAMLSKGRKPDKFESRTLKLRFINILGPLKSNSSDIPALCETNLDDASDFGNFSLKGYLSLIPKKDSLMHGPAVYLKEGVPFSRDLSPEKLRILIYDIDWIYFIHCLTSFFLYRSFLMLFHLT